MGTFSTAAKNTALDALTLTHAVAYEGDPNGAGTALDEQTITFGAAAAGARAATTDPVFNIDAGETVDHIAILDGSGGAIQLSDPVTAEGPYGSAGTYTLTDYTATLSD